MSEATTAAPAAAPAAAPLTAASALIETPAAPAPDAAATPPGDAPAPDAAPDAPPVLTMPGKDATPDEWAAFYTAIGRPETPDGYEMEVPDGDDGAFAKEVAPLLHKAGVTAEQAKVLSQGWNEMREKALAATAAAETQRLQAAHTQNTAEAAALQNEWGQQHEANMHFAKLAAKQFLPADKAGDVISAIESKIGYKATIQFLHSVGKGLGEHDAAGMGQPNGQGRKSAAEILYGATAPKQ